MSRERRNFKARAKFQKRLGTIYSPDIDEVERIARQSNYRREHVKACFQARTHLDEVGIRICTELCWARLREVKEKALNRHGV